MKIYIAKHYWRDGEHAIWESHQKIDKRLFEYLKDNYPKFVAQKPKKIKEGKYHVYLCYEDKKDIYERTITNITFFVVKKESDYNFCNNTTERDLEFEIKDEKDTKKYLFGALIVATIALIAFYLYTKENNEKSITISQNIETRDYSGFIKSWNNRLKEEPELTIRPNNNRTIIDELNRIFKRCDRVNLLLKEDLTTDEIKENLAKELHIEERDISSIVEAFQERCRECS